jgi:hypothetical protein
MLEPSAKVYPGQPLFPMSTYKGGQQQIILKVIKVSDLSSCKRKIYILSFLRIKYLMNFIVCIYRRIQQVMK